jgi:hypothetical protein
VRYLLGALDSPIVRYLIGGIIGLLVGLIVPSIGFGYDLAPLSTDAILDAIITIIVGCALAFVLQHLFQNQQREKDYLMKRLETLSLLAEQLRAQGRVISVAQISLFKEMGTTAHGILTIVKEVRRDALRVEDFDFTADVVELTKLADPSYTVLLDHANEPACIPEVSTGIKKIVDPILDELVGKSHALCGRIAKAELLVIRA